MRLFSRLRMRGGIVGVVLGVGLRVYEYLYTTDNCPIVTSDGRNLRTSKDLRFLKTSTGKILTTSGGRPFYVQAP